MKKLQQYYIYKIALSRLKRSNYSINLSISDARKNGELVSIGDSQMLRSLRKLKGKETNQEEINRLLLEKNKLKKKKYSFISSQQLQEIERLLDEKLFVSEIISVYVDDIRLYKYIGQNGFYVNGKKYARLMCGAGQARRNTSIWISEDFEKPLKTILNNDRKEIEVAPAKFSAYFSLASSASLEV